MSDLSFEDAHDLVRAIADLTSMADRVLPTRVPVLTQRLQAHLGVTESVPNTSASFAVIERPNLQLAFDELQSAASVWEEHGLASDISHYSGLSLPGLVEGTWHGPGESARQFVAVRVSATETIRCLKGGVILTELDGVPVAAMVYESERRGLVLALEVVAATQAAADMFLRRVGELMASKNVLRGKVMAFVFGEHGGFGLSYSSVPDVSREQVILPAWQLEAIEEHTFGITAVSDRLVEAGQHLKRGLLLYGPPGTGKTHTLSYLIGQMAERTTIILSGASVGAVGQAGTIARKLAPATIVIEDVDLIGMDRDLPGGSHNTMLFQLLNEMDGLAPDDDVLFILTTNRADVLEPALAARPGRIDQAIEVGLPDAAGRRRLFELYLHEPVDDDTMDFAVAGTDGAAAAFIKELARRATLGSIRTDATVAQSLRDAIDEMNLTATPLLRSALAASRDAQRPGDAE